MNNTLHTPGPWRVVHASAHEFPNTLRRDIIGKCEFGDAYVAGDISQADARLISAAPELLDVLEAAVARVQIANEEGDCILSAWLHDARAAIAKAKGGNRHAHG